MKMTDYKNYKMRLKEVEEWLDALKTITHDLWNDLTEEQQEDMTASMVELRNHAKSAASRHFEW
jgi:hypothetical protein